MTEYLSGLIPDYREKNDIIVDLQAIRYIMARKRSTRALFENQGINRARSILPRAIEIVRGRRLAKALDVDFVDQTDLDFMLPQLAESRLGAKKYLEIGQSPYED